VTAASARRAEEGEITQELVERKRRRVGLPTPHLEPAFEFANVDSMRNYARGIGDVNPFYRSADHARASRWGTVVAHPTFMAYMGRSVETDFSAELKATGKGDPLAGVHAFYSGDEMEWFRPIREGDRLVVRGGLGSIEAKPSRMGGTAVHEVKEYAYRNQDGELAGVRRQLLIRVDRSRARSQGKNLTLEVPHRYTPEEIAGIYADYENEYIRGQEPRYWEDTEVGETLVPLVKGPYTVTAYICYAEATGPRNDYHRAHSVAYRYAKEHPRAFPPNDLGYPDTVARVHWDKAMALRAGLPETYDFGGERVAWMSHAFTNWMGDDAFLRKINVRLKAFCFVGDTVWIGGAVTAKRRDGADRVVDLAIAATNQRGEEISSATATIILPSRDEPGSTVPASIPSGVSVFA
jgi:acyl dehydratase